MKTLTKRPLQKAVESLEARELLCSTPWYTEYFADVMGSDWAGEEILERWLSGEGGVMTETEGEWGEYMRANKLLAPQIANQLANDAGYRVNSGVVDITFSAEIENGYRSGYELLHGTNSTVGDFTIKGAAHVTNHADGSRTVEYDVKFTWNDVIDPNPNQGMSIDPNWGWLIEEASDGVLTDTEIVDIIDDYFPCAEDYDIHIAWLDQPTVTLDANNAITGTTGYPFDRVDASVYGGAVNDDDRRNTRRTSRFD